MNKQNTFAIRQSLKTEIDALPESVLLTVFEFLSFEKERFHIPAADIEVQNIEKKKTALEHLRKYSGTTHLEKHWKEELYEALDEKYGDPN